MNTKKTKQVATTGKKHTKLDSAKYITVTQACKIVKERGFNLSRVTIRVLIKKQNIYVQFGDWKKIFVDKEKFLAFLDSYGRSEE